MRQTTTLTLALIGLVFLTSFLSKPKKFYSHKTDINFNDSIVISEFEDLSVIIYRKNGYNYFIGQKQKGKYWTKPLLEENMGQIDSFQITRQIINNNKTNNIIINYSFNGVRYKSWGVF